MHGNIEVDFRIIKAKLDMDVLRCKTQPMVDMAQEPSAVNHAMPSHT